MASTQVQTDFIAIDLEHVYSKDEVDVPAHFEDERNIFTDIDIIYPADAREQGIKGKVTITVIVERDGAMTNPKVTKSVYPSLDAEALRVTRLTKTKVIPAEIMGIPVRSEFSFPIGFYLQ